MYGKEAVQSCNRGYMVRLLYGKEAVQSCNRGYTVRLLYGKETAVMQYRLQFLGSCMGRRLCSHAIEFTL